MTQVVISLGSNLGNREATLDFAVKKISEFVDGFKVSRYIETDPVGGPEQPKYLNAVLIGQTTLDSLTLLESLQAIENSAGRTREVRWGARTLDLDIITFGDEINTSEKLTLPHPRAHERFFVLGPWHELDNAAKLPLHGLVVDLLAGL
jgi:2-amino-4-hydroxy-6-hydroxymethyldihydropteridine diphosphokinase